MSTGKFLCGLFFIFLGFIFLGINLGYFSSDIWAEIWKYWPILFVIAGLSIAFGEDKKHWLAISLFIVLILVIFQLFFPQKTYTRSQNDWQGFMNEMHG